MFDVTVIVSSVPSQVSSIVDGETERVASVAACVMRQTELWAPSAVTVICLVFSDVVELAPIPVMVIEKLYSAVAPGSPEMFVPLLVFAELAVYEAGRVIVKSPAPVEKVSFLELDVPVIVTFPPVFPTAAADCMFTNSGFPAWFTVTGLSVTPVARKVKIPLRATLPVKGFVVDTATVSFPLPESLLVLSQLGFAIVICF